MRRAFSVAVSGVLLLPALTSAQEKPDFSGTWTFDGALTAVAVNGPGAGGRNSWPMTLAIKQTRTQMEVESGAYQQLTQTVTYALDGSETTARSAGDITTRAVAVWDGDRLGVTSRRSFNGPQGEVTINLKEVYSLVNGNLTVDRTETQQGKPLTRKVVYSRGRFVPQAALLAEPARPAATEAIPRLPDGKPDFRGFWLGPISAAYSVEAFPASFETGGSRSSVIDPADGKVPYQPWAAAERERRRNDLYNDPEPHCFPSGVPRQMYVMPYQILQIDSHVLILYEYVHARRIITMNKPHTTTNVHFWQGDSVGRWEGDTLVIDSDHFTDKTWLDMDGNFYSENAHVVERLTLVGANTIQYQATFDDSSVFTRPWTMQVMIRRETDAGYQIFESACHEDNKDLEHIKAAYEKGIK